MIPATQLEDLPIRVGLGQFQVPTDSLLAYIKQCGVDDIQMNTATLPGARRSREATTGAENVLRHGTLQHSPC